jgi:PKD repeat protein
MRLFFLAGFWAVFSAAYGQCDASFTTNVSGCNDVTFTPTTNDTSLDYSWDFGDGNTSDERVPTHRYFSFGNDNMNFTATLTVNGDDCSEMSTSEQVMVQEVPNIAITDPSGNNFVRCEPGQITIENASTTNATNVSYEIDWGDGSPVVMQTNFTSLNHVYTSQQAFPITITIEGENGCKNTETFNFIISVAPNINAFFDSGAPVCLPGEAPIELTRFEGNTPNTIYTIRSNDGRDSTIFNHPPPDIYFHPIDTSACNTISQFVSQQNASFQVSITASLEGCPGIEEVQSVGPIRTTVVPKANFEIDPEPNVCQQDLFIVTNTAEDGEFYEPGTGMCITRTDVNWSISPNSGFTFLLGDLNTNEGFTLAFQEPGIYSIRQIVENSVFDLPTNSDPNCPADTLVKTICVIPIPDSEFTPEEASGCTNSDDPLIVDFDNDSNTLDDCDPNTTYTWSVGFIAGECGSPSEPVLIDRTPLNLLDNPSFNDQDIRLRFDSAGIYTVYLRVANDCGVNTDSTIVTVSGAPKIDITPIPDSCFVETFVVTPTLSFDADCFSTPVYEWEFPGGSPNSYTGEFPPAITYDEPGDYTIRLIVENDCGETPVRERFELFPPPSIPNIQVTEEVCVGGTITATNPPPPDPNSNMYSWTGPNGFTASDDEWTISPATAADSGTYILTVTDENGCVNTMNYTVNVTLSAPIQINPDPATVCLGEDLTLTASGGVTYSWGGDHLDEDSGPSVVFNHDVAGDYEVVVIGSDPAGECDGTDTILVTVVPFPVVDAGALRLGCVGTDFDFQPGAIPQISAGTTGSWSGEHITAEGVFNIDVPGEYTVTYSFSNGNGCSDSDEATICIRDQPEAVFTLPVNVGCVADGLILRPENTSNTTDDCSPATYLWTVVYNGSECNTGPGASSFIEGTDSGSLNPAIELKESGEYTLTLVVSSECGSDTATEAVTVGDRPSVTIAEVTDKCGPQPVNFAADISACNSDITTYSWDFPTADPPATSDVATPEPIPFSIGVHTVALAVTNACGTKRTTQEFEVLEGPVIDISLPADSVCIVEELVVSGNSSGTDLTFSWTASNSNISFSDASIETPTIGFTGVPLGQHSVTVTVSNSVCDPVMTTFNVYLNDEPTVSLNPIGDGCGSHSFIPGYGFVIPLENIDVFQWELNDGTSTEIISTEANPGEITVSIPGNYILTLTATNACGTDDSSQNFRVLEGPDPNFDVDNTQLCRGEVNTITLTDRSGGDIDDYDWTVTTPDGDVFTTSSEPSPTFTFNGMAELGEYSIRVLLSNSQCMPATPWDTTIVLNATPTAMIETINDQCTEIRFTPRADFGEFDDFVESVLWTFPTGSVPATSTDFEPGEVFLDQTGTDLQVTLMVTNRCGTSTATETFDLLEGPSLDVGLDTTFVCRGESISVTNNSMGDNLDFSWSVAPATGVIIDDETTRSPVITFNGDPDAYVITATIGNDLCERLTYSQTIEVSDAPEINITSLMDGCGQTSISPQVTYGLADELIDSVYWEVMRILGADAGAVIYSGAPSGAAIDVLGAGTYAFTATAFNRCAPAGVSNSVTFRLYESPVGNYATDTDFICRGTGSVSLTSNFTGDIDTYEWTVTEVNNGQVVTSLASTEESPTFTFGTNLSLGDYTIAVSLGNAECDNIPWDTLVTLSAIPAGFTLSTIGDECDNITFDPTPDYGEFTAEFVDSVRWTFPAGSTPATSTELDPGPVSLSTTGIDLEVRLDVFNPCGTDSTSTTFDLLIGPVLDVTVDTTFVCRGDAVNVTNNSAGDNLVYNWTADPATDVNFSDPNGQAPMITFDGEIGTYTISAMIGNPVCGTLDWDTIIRVNDQPTVLINMIPDYCDTALVPLSGDFSAEAFIDSVNWRLEDEAGTLLFSSTSFAPAAAPLGVGRYTVRAAVFNECGSEEDSEEFRVFAGPMLDLRLDTARVCLDGSPVVTIENNSTGDSLSYSWTVTPGGQIGDPSDTTPTITFSDTGLYVIVVEVSNPVCDPVFWTDTVLVSEGPQLAIDPIGDFCGEANISPIGTFNNLTRLDSLRWYFPGATDSTSTLSDPGQRTYSSPGTYTVSLLAWNSCGQDSTSTTFRVLEPIVVEASADANFSCDLPFVVTVTNATAGDDLNYDWRIEGPFAANVLFDAEARDPVFTIQDTGTYVIIQRVFNETCGAQFWRDTVTALAAPLPILTDQTQFCEEASLTPGVDYGSYRLDSVVWRFPGSQLDPPTTNELFPANVPYSGAGTYTYTVTAYNACGAQSVADTFVIDTIPEIILGPTDTICITDGLFTVPAAMPTGGIWRDSLGRPGVITEGGIFNPVVATGGVWVIEYVYTIGACEVITQKDIFVVDLSDVAVVPDVLNACVTETQFILNNGTPGPGWYTGPGVTDSLGVMDPSSLGEGTYELTYHYQAPGTNCIETRDFTVNVRPLPVPIIQVTDSICVNIPVDIIHAGSGAVAWEWNIGDGTMYSTENIVHTFLDTGFQRIQLISTSEFGCQDSISREIYVSGPPIVFFTKDTTMGCALLPVNFDNESIGFQFVRYGWDFGNGETSTEFNPSTLFYDQGNVDTTYYINLAAINACGEDSYRDSVIVFPNPKAFLDVSQDEGCTPLYVEFLNITSGLPDRFEWYIDGALYSTDSIAPDRSFIAPDSMNTYYEVMLIAYNECGIDTARRTITVLPDNVRAFFSVEDQVGCEPFDVQFRNFSDPDTLVTFDWFFGDGSTSQLKNPLHTFRNTSDTTLVYEVTLVADNGCGQDSIMIPITVNPAPQVSFTAPPITCARDTVFFTNTSEDVTNPIWVFGDGDTLTMAENPGHVFMQPGNYTVELTAFAIGTGCPNTWTETINIRPIPIANASAAPLFGCPPLEVSVNNLSIDADFYFWDYGDGNTSVGPAPLPHAYAEPGIYDITLTASDEFGCKHDSVVATIQVYEVPVVNFITEPERQCGVPTEVCFENNSENGGDYRWDFGNGQTSGDNNPCVTYETSGDYVISLVATNEFLCETRTEIPISVYGIPVANFSIPDSTVCEVATVTFTNTSQEAEFAQWIFSDGFVSNAFNVTRTFTEVGIYGFTLIVGNGSGCSDTLVTGNFLEVNPSPIADFDLIDRPDRLPTTIEFTDLSSSDAILFGWDFDDGTGSDEMNPVHRYLSSFDKTVVHWVENEFGCTDTIEMVVDLDTLGALYIPNIFTPEDASTPEKDIFKPKGIGLRDYYIAVYTRNGQIVWESDMVDEEGVPEESWDGTFQGQLMPPATYLWRVHRASFFNGRPWRGMEDDRGELRRTGYVTLVR